MKLVKVHIPFTDKETGRLHGVNEEIELSEERIAEIKAISVNMIEVIGDVAEVEKPKRTRKKN
ncbi:MAG: hypothetical protein E7288_10515 [Lachnospiraceae bacterium]|nr:hypothetical protein [Lachnospiraceae bacterium]